MNKSREKSLYFCALPEFPELLYKLALTKDGKVVIMQYVKPTRWPERVSWIEPDISEGGKIDVRSSRKRERVSGQRVEAF